MGAGQSRGTEEKVFPVETSISFSEDVVNHLSDRSDSTEMAPERQTVLDAHIRARIQSELERLKQEEQNVCEEIERALEKENLDQESSMAGSTMENDGSGIANVKSSATLSGDLDEMQNKITRYQQRRGFDEHLEVKATSEAIVECYRQRKTTTLDCWSEVRNFKTSVRQLEKQYFKTLQS